MPMIEALLVEVPNPAHPYGAKGVGEVNIVPPMAAIANAIDSVFDILSPRRYVVTYHAAHNGPPSR
jgi:CO/xanthine dehydrogenase Mo-binding subunit